MRPRDLKTKIFLDGGDPGETREISDLLGFLDGQTTNPTLISKNPQVQKRIESGKKFSQSEILSFYRSVVKEIADLIPRGSISIEVYADQNTNAGSMYRQGKEMFSWIPNAHIKLPIAFQGLKAAEFLIKEGIKINMTLCFSQEQAAAVYAATRKATKGQVFVSPFVGRLDDQGENGMDLIRNIIKMYKSGDGHVEVLTASVRSLNHLLYALQLNSDVITAPFKILKEWGEKRLPLPAENYLYHAPNLKPVPYENLDLDKNWQKFNIVHPLTNAGISKFAEDWDKLIN